jgi:transposase
MNHDATKGRRERFWIWLLCLLVISAVLSRTPNLETGANGLLLGIAVESEAAQQRLWPWQRVWRVKKWAYARYKAWQAHYRQAKRARQLAQLALAGMMPLAHVVDALTAKQVRYKLGALPVLYALLETLEVRQIINRHCPSKAEIAHGTVALVLVLNRLLLPLPLSQVADWVGQTVLVAVLGIPAGKFNDDRLGRTLDALHEQLAVIWRDIIDVAIRKANIDLSVIFYDVTGVVAHGNYTASGVIDFGFAHNTPSNKRKAKIGLAVSADGNLPWLYQLWSGRTADPATVASNLENLSRWLHTHGYPLQTSLIVGDRAMLNAEIAIAYDEKGLRHLTGLRTLSAEHKELVSRWTDEQFAACPLVEGAAPQYWGRGCRVTLTHAEKTVTHKGLVVLAGPLRDQLRQARQAKLDALDSALTTLRACIGQGRLTTVKALQRSVNARLKQSGVAHFVITDVQQTATGLMTLHWLPNTQALAQARRQDGRYLLVTNDEALSHREMFRLYRQKDGVETAFHICKSDLKVSPLFLHQDQRIAAMLFINMLALLAYNLLQRQVQQQGLHLTTRRMIQQLESLVLIETTCIDGSVCRRLVDVDPELLTLLAFVASSLNQMVHTVTALSDARAPRRLSDSLANPTLLC